MSASIFVGLTGKIASYSFQNILVFGADFKVGKLVSKSQNNE